jgi:hypothetical protein
MRFLAARCVILGVAWLLVVATPSARADVVHHYPFTVDAADVVGGADGTLMDGAVVSGGVLTLDGTNDFVQIGQHIVPTSGSYTVAM